MVGPPHPGDESRQGKRHDPQIEPRGRGGQPPASLARQPIAGEVRRHTAADQDQKHDDQAQTGAHHGIQTAGLS